MRKQAVPEFVAVGVITLKHCLRFMSRLADGISNLKCCMVNPTRKMIDPKNPHMMLYEILMNIVMNNIKVYDETGKDFKKAIVELAVLNEYATNLNKRSCYLSGDPNLLSLKRWIYPYWLMYLGVKKEELYTYMARDKISFDQDKYAYEKELKKMNLEEFIDFCIRNKRYIIREPKS